MTETFFSINDLLRRKMQTALTVLNMALCVSSTIFLLSLSGRLGFGIFSIVGTKLTAGLSIVVSKFVVFVGILIFVSGATIISFLTFIMMSRRLKDIGLMKAAGCPNNLVFGYFLNELLITTLAGCTLGVVLGTAADYVSSIIMNLVGLKNTQTTIDLGLVLVVFVAFFAFSSTIGVKIVLDSAKVSPARALSPGFQFGLSKESDFRGTSRAGHVTKMAVRNLFRRKSTSLQITLCLASVFLLLTVGVAGAAIANSTTNDWVKKAAGKDMFVIAHEDMCSQYKLLLSRFYGDYEVLQFDYMKQTYQLPENLETELLSIPELAFDSRMIIEAETREIPGIRYGKTTGETTIVGDNREGVSLIIGVEPESSSNRCVLNGYPLREDQPFDALLGDTIALEMFSSPLVQNISIFHRNFQIVGVCVDPINNGNVTYISLDTLQFLTGASRPNLIVARIVPSADPESVLTKVRAALSVVSPELECTDISEIVEKSQSFMGLIWSFLMLLPLLSLVAAAMCLASYVILSMEEMKHEFAILRAIGAKPNAIVKIVATQNSLILLGSWASGVSLGLITTLIILIPEPLVTANSIFEIFLWLASALTAMLAVSIYPAFRFSRKPVLEAML